MGFVAGFGKGSFKLVKSDKPLAESAIVFNVASDKDLVVLNGVVLELGKVVMDQRETKPDAQFCYHKMDISNEGPNTFTLAKEHCVVFSFNHPRRTASRATTLLRKSPPRHGHRLRSPSCGWCAGLQKG